MYKSKAIEEVSPRAYSTFSCDVEALDIFLRRFAKNNHKKGIGKTFLLLEEDRAIGFYTISMASVEFHTLPSNIQMGIPKYPIPVARIGRLGVDKAFKGKGLGKLLLLDAIARIAEASKVIATYCIIVDAIDEKAAEFYKKFGFEALKDDPMCLFLPMSLVIELDF